MRRGGLVLVLSVALLAAGCGSKKSSDPGRDVMAELVAAVKAHDADAIWERVTKATQGRLGKARTVALVEKELAPFTRGSYRLLLSQLVTERFGLVAITTPKAIVALPFAKEDGRLRADLGAPLRVEPTGPRPGVHTEHVPHQVAVEVTGGPRVEPTAILYLDGDTLLATIYGTAASATVFSNLPQAFTKGRHTVIAFAATDFSAAATAWSFTVR